MELLIVGLDGLSYNVVDRFDVRTPFLEEVRSSGVSGDLASVDPPTTLPAWTSFATGRDPGSHGVFTMLEQHRDYEIRPATPNETSPAVYDLLDDALFVNLPASVGREPAGEDVSLVPSFLATDADEAIPAELAHLEATADYVVQGDTSLQSRPEAYLEHLREVAAARWRFAAQAFDDRDPRVGFVLFSTPDWVGHFLQHAPDHETAGEWYRSVVEPVDEYAADLAEDAENVLLLSDHGFEHKARSLHLQTWFRDEGHLEIDETDRSVAQHALTGVATRVARHFRPGFRFARSLYTRFGADGSGGVEDLVDLNPDLDYADSAAWHLRYGCCYVNDDRFDDAVVDDPERFAADLRDDLAGLTGPDGDPVFEDVFLADDVYEAPDERAPDVVARPANGYLPLRALSPTGDPVKRPPSDTFYDHRRRGLLAARGPLFASGTVTGASIVDVLPTILHALDESLPPGLDGTVVDDLLATDSSPSVMDPAAVPSPALRTHSGASSTTVTDRLADLGYLE